MRVLIDMRIHNQQKRVVIWTLRYEFWKSQAFTALSQVSGVFLQSQSDIFHD